MGHIFQTLHFGFTIQENAREKENLCFCFTMQNCDSLFDGRELMFLLYNAKCDSSFDGTTTYFLANL
jgi:hypothetical protein